MRLFLFTLEQTPSCLSRLNPPLLLQMLCQVAACLGYTTKEQFLEDHLVSMVTQWLTDGFRIEAFPCKLFGFDEVKDFLL